MFREARKKVIISEDLSGSSSVPAFLLTVTENVKLRMSSIAGALENFDLFLLMILLCTKVPTKQTHTVVSSGVPVL